MATCTYVKKSGSICNKRASGVRCVAHKGKRNKLRRRKSGGKKLRHTDSVIRFYDVTSGKTISVPRNNCRISRSTGRGGDQVYTVVNGRKLYTFVERGFDL